MPDATTETEDTLHESLERRLILRQLTREEARKIMETAIPRINGTIPGIEDFWLNPVEECPYETYKLIWEKLLIIVLEWIKEDMDNNKTMRGLFSS